MLPAGSCDGDMQLFQRTLLCSWDFGIGDPLLYVGQEYVGQEVCRREDFELELGISCTRGTFSPSSHAEFQQV